MSSQKKRKTQNTCSNPKHQALGKQIAEMADKIANQKVMYKNLEQAHCREKDKNVQLVASKEALRAEREAKVQLTKEYYTNICGVACFVSLVVGIIIGGIF